MRVDIAHQSRDRWVTATRAEQLCAYRLQWPGSHEVETRTSATPLQDQNSVVQQHCCASEFAHPSDPVKTPAWLWMCGSGYIPMFTHFHPEKCLLHDGNHTRAERKWPMLEYFWANVASNEAWPKGVWESLSRIQGKSRRMRLYGFILIMIICFVCSIVPEWHTSQCQQRHLLGPQSRLRWKLHLFLFS